MKSIQVWFVCFVLFFGAAEFYQWLQGITLPMPAFILAGAFLAVASNADKLPLKGTLPLPPLQPNVASPKTPPSQPTAEAIPQSSPSLPSPPSSSTGWSATSRRRSISLTIHNPQSVQKTEMREQPEQRES